MASPAFKKNDWLSFGRYAIGRIKNKQHTMRKSLVLNKSADLAIVGSYTSSNLGDRALGHVVAQIADELGYRAVLCPFPSIHRLPRNLPCLVSGGSVVHPSCAGSYIRKISEHFLDMQRVAMVGVSGHWGGERNRLEQRILSECGFLSTRSQAEVVSANHAGQRKDVFAHPDIVWAWGPFEQSNTDTPQKPIVGVNIVPPFLRRHGRYWSSIQADTAQTAWIQHAGSGTQDYLKRFSLAYTDAIRQTVIELLRQGYRVRSIPMTIEDELFARSILRNISVKHISYTADPTRIRYAYHNCQYVIATRLHAHIFAMLSRTSILSIQYAKKVADLWSDLDLDPNRQLTRDQVVDDPDAAAQWLLTTPALKPDEKFVGQNAAKAKSAIKQAIETICSR